MALTERDDVISLAGGLPDTSTFPADSYASLMSTVAVQSCARALQYAPTEGLTLVKQCISQVMHAEGMEIDADELLVTTGGQQVIDLVTKTLIDRWDRLSDIPGCRHLFGRGDGERASMVRCLSHRRGRIPPLGDSHPRPQAPSTQAVRRR